MGAWVNGYELTARTKGCHYGMFRQPRGAANSPRHNGNATPPIPATPNTSSKTRKAYPTEAAALRGAAASIAKKKGVAFADVQHVHTWTFRNRDGSESFRIARFNILGCKDYRPIHRNGEGWLVSDPEGKLPLYRLDELDLTRRLHLCEGEKCADILRGLGLNATTWAHGASAIRKTDWSVLNGCPEVVYQHDNDPAGATSIAKLTEALSGIDTPPQLAVIDLKTLVPDLPAKGDIEQAVKALGTQTSEDIAAALDALADGAGFVDVTASEATFDARPESQPGPIPESRNAATVTAPAPDFPYTDLGNAERLAHEHGADLRYTASHKWLVYDEVRWKRDKTGEVRRRFTDTVRGMYKQAAAINDADQRKALVSHARGCESLHRVKAAVELCQSHADVATTIEAFDADPWLLNTLTGVIDLKTGYLRPHRREDLMMKLAPVEYTPDAKCARWDRFLREIFDCDVTLIDYAQRAVGYAVTGVVRENIAHFLYGAGANGKSTFLDVLSFALGDYARTAPPKLLIQRTNDAHPTELATLHGTRFVTSVETGERRVLDEERLKQLTGKDRISCRYMRADFFEFEPTHTLFLCTNHKPIIQGTDHAIWRRIALWPFTVQIPDRDQDPDLADKLKREAPGILAWVVRGCLEWRRRGEKLEAPECVLDATAKYRTDSDLVGDWLDTCCLTGDEWVTERKTLYRSYSAWATESGITPMSNIAFGRMLGERGYRQERRGGTTVHHGLWVRP